MLTVGIVQARTDSARLHGKILSPIIEGTSSLEVLWARIRQVDIPWWLATTKRPEDDELSEKAALLGFQVLRGETEDVLSRYEAISEATGANLIVKVNGDNPTTGAEAIRCLIAEASLIGLTEFMIADTGTSRRYPRGHVPQILDREALASIRRRIPEGDNFHRTHVTSVLLEKKTKQTQIKLGPRAPHLRWTVDSVVDLQTVRGLFRSLDVPFERATYRDFLKAASQDPVRNQRNQNERQKAIEDG